MDKKKLVLIIIIIGILLAVSIYIIFNSEKLWMNSDKQSNFELIFNEDISLGEQKLISKDNSNKNPFDVFSYNGKVKVIIDNKEYDLKEALNSNKLTAMDILNKAQEDAYNNIIEIEIFKDGGTIEYYYNDYIIKKYNTLNGYDALFIGTYGL